MLDPVELLAQAALLQGVARRHLIDLAHASSVREAAAREAIVSEGERDDRYYVLLSGRARVTVAGEERRELIAGDGFGEIAVLHGVPRTATVTAIEDCRLLTVGGDDLRAAVATRGGRFAELAEARNAPQHSENLTKITAPAGRRSDDGTGPLEIEEEGRV